MPKLIAVVSSVAAAAALALPSAAQAESLVRVKAHLLPENCLSGVLSGESQQYEGTNTLGQILEPVCSL